MKNGTTNLEMALIYAAKNLRVVPLHGTVKGRCTCGNEKCIQPGRHPRTKKGIANATADRGVVEQMWGKWPNAKIAIAMGANADLFAMVADGPTGWENLLNLVQANEKLPPTVIVLEGEQCILLFRAGGANLGHGVIHLAKGLKILTGGEFIVAPSSIDDRPGAPRGFIPGHVLGEAKLPELPRWLLILIRERVRAATTAAEISRLARLSEIDYEREREKAAERLKFRVSVLDKLVQQARTESNGNAGKQGTLSLREQELWREPVDGAILLTELTRAVLRYVVVPKNTAPAIALWVVHTYALPAFSITPRLAIKSPVKNCGKSTLLDVLSCLVCRPLATANITAAAVFRIVDAASPTLLIDEADTFLVNNNELRGILNSGHRRSLAQIVRVEGENLEPREFATFAAAAIAAIGSLPDTLEDRSIRVNLKRRRPDERIELLDLNNVDHLTELACKAARWASDHLVELTAANPEVPPTLVNREADNWRPLLAIADAAGGKWPDGMRRIAEDMTASARNHEESVKVMLLRDIQAAFAENKVDRMSSATLVESLVEMEGHPWCEWKGNQPLTQNALALLLRDFEIRPVELRINGRVLRGYKIEQFTDAFGRYASDGS
jgi:Protein of unknown function (DUF3631)/Bifunctional DNA primase/polymerase, N-terminal